MTTKTQDFSEKKDARKRSKKPYSKPQLTMYGSVERLTGTGNGKNLDGHNGSKP
jgi:hypothetical protein